MKRIKANVYHSQTGYILFMTMCFLIVFSMMTIQMLDRNGRSNKIANIHYETVEARFFAEASMNYAYSLFVNDYDFDNDTIVDNSELGVFNPDMNTLSYVFYVTGGSHQVDQTVPSILQRIANGEARSNSTASVDAASVRQSDTALGINSLFGNGFRPLLFIQNNNQVTRSVETWATESAYKKSAAWLEIVNDPNVTDRRNIYIQVATSAGPSRSYLQRFIGSVTFTPNDKLGGTLSPFMQNSK